MLGKNVGTLTVYMRNVGASSAYPEWTKSGEVGDDWNVGYININNNRPYQVRLACQDKPKRNLKFCQ